MNDAAQPVFFTELHLSDEQAEWHAQRIERMAIRDMRRNFCEAMADPQRRAEITWITAATDEAAK